VDEVRDFICELLGKKVPFHEIVDIVSKEFRLDKDETEVIVEELVLEEDSDVNSPETPQAPNFNGSERGQTAQDVFGQYPVAKPVETTRKPLRITHID
jgi:hypothetical protein